MLVFRHLQQFTQNLIFRFPLGIFRAKIVLKHYRGFELAKGERFSAWVNRLLEHPAFKATCSAEQLYLDSYERFVIKSQRSCVDSI